MHNYQSYGISSASFKFLRIREPKARVCLYRSGLDGVLYNAFPVDDVDNTRINESGFQVLVAWSLVESTSTGTSLGHWGIGPGRGDEWACPGCGVTLKPRQGVKGEAMSVNEAL